MKTACIDFSCPAELFQTTLPTEETPAARLILYNLSDRVIVSAEVSLRLTGSAGAELERLTCRGRGLNGRPHSTFSLTVPCPGQGVKGAEGTIETVWFADGETWRRDPAREVSYTPNTLPVSPDLTALRFAAGETAAGYPTRQGTLWLCVCGRPNPQEADQCRRCGRMRDEVFARFSPEAVRAQVTLRERQLDLNSRNLREDTIRLQRIREEAWQAQKVRRALGRRLAAGFALCLLLCAGLWLWGIPGLRLAAGRHALDAGEYARAEAIFQSLGSFGGAEKLTAEAQKQAAEAEKEPEEQISKPEEAATEPAANPEDDLLPFLVTDEEGDA